MQRLNSNAYDTKIMNLEEEFGANAGAEAIIQDLTAIGESGWAEWVDACRSHGRTIILAHILERMPCDFKNRLN